MLYMATRRELASYFAMMDRSVLRPASGKTEIGRLKVGENAIEFSSENPGVIPSRIIVADSEIEDFFAWSSTYIDTLTPLTSFVEVLSQSEALFGRSRPDLTERQRSALLGATLMDGLLQSKSRMRVPDAILPATLRTVSAVFAQALMEGNGRQEIADATSMWALVRSTLRGSEMPFDINAVLSFWGTVSPAYSPELGDSEGSISSVVTRFFKLNSPANPFEGTQYDRNADIGVGRIADLAREDRIRLADERLKSLASSRVPREVQAAIGGYLLSLVADGDFALWPTAADFGALTTMPLWFGLFVGGAVRSNLLTYSQSIARRLSKMLDYHPTDVDIDARELIISRRLKTRASTSIDFPLSTYNVLKAKLAPRVCGWFSVRESAPVQSGVPDGRSTQVDTIAIPSRQIQDLRNSVERMYLLLTSINLNYSAAPNIGDQGQFELNVREKPAPRKRKRSGS